MFPLSRDQSRQRRAEPRRTCHQHCLVHFDRVHFDGHPGSIGAEGYISDLSACGVGLLLRQAIPSGATLTIDPLGSSAVSLPPAHVVRCVPMGRRWRHGCCLDRRLTEGELRGWLA